MTDTRAKQFVENSCRYGTLPKHRTGIESYLGYDQKPRGSGLEGHVRGRYGVYGI